MICSGCPRIAFDQSSVRVTPATFACEAAMKNLPLIAIAPVALTIVACEPREVPATLEARYRQEDLVRFHSVYRDLCRIGRARACTAEHMIRETLREGGVCY